jgi:hypothetical protein
MQMLEWSMSDVIEIVTFRGGNWKTKEALKQKFIWKLYSGTCSSRSYGYEELYLQGYNAV